jgi:hypothetical protein
MLVRFRAATHVLTLVCQEQRHLVGSSNLQAHRFTTVFTAARAHQAGGCDLDLVLTCEERAGGCLVEAAKHALWLFAELVSRICHSLELLNEAKEHFFQSRVTHSPLFHIVSF